MVVFEILSSHLHMSRWHEAKIDQHTHDLEALQEAAAKMRERLQSLDQVSVSWTINCPEQFSGSFYAFFRMHESTHKHHIYVCDDLLKAEVARAGYSASLTCIPVKQDEASSPGAQNTALAHLAENGASADSLTMDEDSEDTEEGAANAGIAAVVERTLQQAVVSKSLAAGRSGTLGTSDSLEAHAPAVPEAESRPSMLGIVDSSARNALADTEKAEGGSASHQPGPASLDTEQEVKPGSASAAESLDAGPSGEAPDQSSTAEQHHSPSHADSKGIADASPGSKQNLLDTGQGGFGEASSRENGSTEAARTSTPEPEHDPAQPSTASRADSATPGKATRRKSQADSRALEREYLEGELDALGEKEQEEVGTLAPRLCHSSCFYAV